MTFFSPASITCFFSVHSADEPRLSGSSGVGLTPEMGARASISSRGSGIRVNGVARDFPTVEYVMDKLGCKCGMDIELDFPAECGFGMSGASALTTAFEVDKTFNLKRSFYELADLAHEAEIVCRTGMGDVVCQCSGGVVVRKMPGAPSRAVIDRFLWDMELDLLVLGPLSTRNLLDDDEKVNRINELGKDYVGTFLSDPQMENLFRLSRNFATETGLLDSKLEHIIDEVESAGGKASMVMLGRAIFAVNGSEVLQDYGDLYRVPLSHCGVKKVN
ncbi:MAG: pantoate kinase [Archaeoglobaceae archaeon]